MAQCGSVPQLVQQLSIALAQTRPAHPTARRSQPAAQQHPLQIQKRLHAALLSAQTAETRRLRRLQQGNGRQQLLAQCLALRCVRGGFSVCRREAGWDGVAQARIKPKQRFHSLCVQPLPRQMLKTNPLVVFVVDFFFIFRLSSRNLCRPLSFCPSFSFHYFSIILFCFLFFLAPLFSSISLEKQI